MRLISHAVNRFIVARTSGDPNCQFIGSSSRRRLKRKPPSFPTTTIFSRGPAQHRLQGAYCGVLLPMRGCQRIHAGLNKEFHA